MVKLVFVFLFGVLLSNYSYAVPIEPFVYNYPPASLEAKDILGILEPFNQVFSNQNIIGQSLERVEAIGGAKGELIYQLVFKCLNADSSFKLKFVQFDENGIRQSDLTDQSINLLTE